MENITISDADIELIINDLLEWYGYDFSNYSRASFIRRINRIFEMDKIPSLAEFRYRLRNKNDYLKWVIEHITVNVTEMFRDPHFYKSIREEVIPVLATQPFIRIWLAGCASGEEVYSIAILLNEANLLGKSLLYATDLSPIMLEKVKKGIFPISQMKLFSENYMASGGKEDFSNYYTAMYDKVKFKDYFSSRIIVSPHNLVCDRSFNQFQLVICRNVLIYFEKVLQDRVLTLFDNSLESLGYLALGTKENIKFSTISQKYKQFDNREKIWKKIR